MIRGLYTAASGMLAGLARQDGIAQDLANVNTPGYKRQEVILGAFPQVLLSRLGDPTLPLPAQAAGEALGPLGLGTAVDRSAVVFEQGALRQTGEPGDLALEGPGFFAVATPRGVRYTRNGSFSVDGQGRLVTGRGHPVLGSDGQPVRVGGGSFEVSEAGEVTAGGRARGRLALAVFDDASVLERDAEGLFAGPPAPDGAPGPRVRQGYLEQANVDLVEAMVRMIAVFRAYEASQKAVQAADEVLQKAANEVARL